MKRQFGRNQHPFSGIRLYGHTFQLLFDFKPSKVINIYRLTLLPYIHHRTYKHSRHAFCIFPRISQSSRQIRYKITIVQLSLLLFSFNHAGIQVKFLCPCYFHPIEVTHMQRQHLILFLYQHLGVNLRRIILCASNIIVSFTTVNNHS